MIHEFALVAELPSALVTVTAWCHRAAEQVDLIAQMLAHELEGESVQAIVDELIGYAQRILRAAHIFANLQWQWMLEGH